MKINKIIKSNIIVIPLILLASTLTILNVAAGFVVQHLSIDYQNDSFLFDLSGPEYLVYTSRNDTIESTQGASTKAFNENDELSIDNDGINFSFIRRNITENVATDYLVKNTTSFYQLDNKIDLISDITFIDRSFLDIQSYSIQLDFSGTAEISQDNDYVYWKTTKCTILLQKRNNINYIDFENNKSILLEQDVVSANLKFILNLEFDCNV